MYQESHEKLQRNLDGNLIASVLSGDGSGVKMPKMVRREDQPCRAAWDLASCKDDGADAVARYAFSTKVTKGAFSHVAPPRCPQRRLDLVLL